MWRERKRGGEHAAAARDVRQTRECVVKEVGWGDTGNGRERCGEGKGRRGEEERGKRSTRRNGAGNNAGGAMMRTRCEWMPNDT